MLIQKCLPVYNLSQESWANIRSKGEWPEGEKGNMYLHITGTGPDKIGDETKEF